MGILSDSAGRIAKLQDGTLPFTAIDVNGGAIDATPIGGTTAAAGAFTTLSSSGAATLNSASITTTLGVTGVLTASNASNAIRIGTSCDLTTPPAIGGVTPAAGAFTTLSASGATTLAAMTATTGTFSTSLKTNDDIPFYMGTGNDFQMGYDSSADAWVASDSGGSPLFAIADVGTAAYPVYYTTTMDVFRDSNTIGHQVAYRLSLSDGTNPLPSVEWRGELTDNTAASEDAKTSLYLITAGSLAKKYEWTNAGVFTAGDGTGAPFVNASGAAASQFGLGIQVNGSNRWRWLKNNDSESGSNAGSSLLLVAYSDAGSQVDVPLNMQRAAKGLVKWSRHMEIQTNSTEAAPALLIDNDDTDTAFINFEGSSSTGVAQHITTWTSGNTIQGFVQVEINGTTGWMPFYDAPTS